MADWSRDQAGHVFRWDDSFFYINNVFLIFPNIALLSEKIHLRNKSILVK